MWRRKPKPKHTSSSVEQGGDNFMAWPCMDSSGTGPLIIIDYVTHDGSSKMNSEVHRNILSATLKTDLIKLTGRSSFMQQDNNPKHTTKTAKEFIRGKKWKLFDWPQKKNAKVWRCQWDADLMQSLQAKDLQINIKYYSPAPILSYTSG